MKYFHKFLIASVISFHLVIAGTTGKLVGIVLDKVSKEPLIGANVMIAGTGLGTSTDADGRYFILQIPPKTYSVKFSMIGYKDVNVKNVKIQVDLTTTLNAEMEEGVIGMEPVEVTAQRPMVQPMLLIHRSILLVMRSICCLWKNLRILSPYKQV